MSAPTLRAVVRETWTLDRCGGTRVELLPEEPHKPQTLVCWDHPSGHHTFLSLEDMPWRADALTLARWISEKIDGLLRAHRQPYNRLRGQTLPSVDEATYFLADSVGGGRTIACEP